MQRYVYCVFLYTDRGQPTDTYDLHEIFKEEASARSEAAILARDLGGEWKQEEDFSWTQGPRIIFVERRMLG